jgi:ribose 5-phosphate isomerase A
VTHHAGVAGGLDDPGVQAVATKALELIADGARVGLGSGRAASLFITNLGLRRQDGLRVIGVPTSHASAYTARKAGIPLIELGQDTQLDIMIDGADEVAPNLDLVKGWGGALVRERIVAAASRHLVILVGAEKLVRGLGQRGPVPVEVIPFARWVATKQLRALGLAPILRMTSTGARPFVSENGNFTLDCTLPEPMRDRQTARELERALHAIVGIVDTGLFLGTANQVLVGHPDGRVDTLRRAEY